MPTSLKVDRAKKSMKVKGCVEKQKPLKQPTWGLADKAPSIVAAAIASSMFLTCTATSAHAQSSFGSSSVEVNTNQDAKSIRYATLFNEIFVALKHEPNSIAQDKADELLQRALDGELEFKNDLYEEESGDRYSVVDRVTGEQLDQELAYLKAVYANIAIYPTDGSLQFGIAAGKDDQYYYLARSVF